MQWEHYAFIHTRVANPFIAATRHHLIKPFKPTQAAASVQFSERRINYFAHRRSPANPNVSRNSFQNVHTARGNHRNSHSAGVNVDDANALLASAMQDPHPDAEWFVRFQTEVLAGNLEVFCGLIGIEQYPLPSARR